MPFRPLNVRFLRLFQGKTQLEVAEAVSASEAAIWQIERGREPNDTLREALAIVLGVDVAFFYDDVRDEFTERDCSFRKGSRSAERIRKRVLAQATLFSHVVRFLQERLSLPASDVPVMSAGTDEEVEQAADACRDHWCLGLDTPIVHMGRVLEHAGVMVTRLRDDETACLDAFSRRGRDGAMSFVVLNPAKGSTSRTRFDMAHELGHLVLHPSSNTDYATMERQADRFASAFLLPRSGFGREFSTNGRVNWNNVFDMKRRWKVSAQAIVYRAYHLNMIDAVELRRSYKYLSAHGWLKSEPAEPEAEAPELFRKAMRILWQRRKTGVPDVASALHWTVQTFEDVTGFRAMSTGGDLVEGDTRKVVSLVERRRAPVESHRNGNGGANWPPRQGRSSAPTLSPFVAPSSNVVGGVKNHVTSFANDGEFVKPKEGSLVSKNEQTSKRVAKVASQVLRTGKATPKQAKTLAASTLTQAPNKKKGK